MAGDAEKPPKGSTRLPKIRRLKLPGSRRILTGITFRREIGFASFGGFIG